jgi:peptide/nickel transport system substrate-binding protein
LASPFTSPERLVKNKYDKEEKVMKKAILTLTTILLLVGLVLGGCGEPETTTTTTTPSTTTPTTTPSPTTSKYGGTLKVCTTASSPAFGYPPLIAFGAHFAASPAIEYLLDFDVNGVPRPDLAKDFEIDVEGNTFTIHLREGVRFHDGTDCDAEAVKWNMEQFAIAEVPLLTSVTSIDVVDKWTVRLNLSSFSNSLLYDLVLAGGMVISPTAAEENGIEWTYTHPVGTGPFKFESFQRDVSLKYVRNDDYWDEGKPYLDALEWVYISDPTAQELALRAGEVDSLVGIQLMSHDSLVEEGFIIKKAPFGVWGLYPDSKNPDSPFAIKEVREAVEYAIDKQAIADALGYGVNEAAYQEADPGRNSYVPDLPPRLYDVAKARELLEQADYANGFETTITATIGTDEDLLVSLQTDLAAVGIVADIDLVDTGKFFDYYYNGWNNRLLYWFTPSEPRSFDAFNNSFAPTGIYNASVIKTAEIGELLTHGQKETDPAKLAADVQGVVRILYEEALTIPVWLIYAVGAENPKVRDTGLWDEARCFKVHATWGDAYFVQ